VLSGTPDAKYAYSHARKEKGEKRTAGRRERKRKRRGKEKGEGKSDGAHPALLDKSRGKSYKLVAGGNPPPRPRNSRRQECI